MFHEDLTCLSREKLFPGRVGSGWLVLVRFEEWSKPLKKYM